MTEEIKKTDNPSTINKTDDPTGFKVIVREFKKDKLATFSFFFLVALFLFVFIMSNFIDESEFTKVILGKKMRYMKPNFSSLQYFFGTDDTGRSIMYQLIVGARNSITIGFAVTIFSSMIGITVGLIIGYFGGKVDAILMRIIDFISVLPTLMIIIVFVTIIPNYTMWHFVLIMSVFYWVGTARLVRSKSLSESRRDYVNASKTMGTPDWKIMLGGILPNISSIIIVDLTLAFAGNIGIETGLTFLGFGLPPEVPSLGTLVALAKDSHVLQHRMWVWLPASLLIFIMMLSINYVGQALRRASDAKQRLG